MAGRSLTDRVEVLEQKVEGLQTLPGKVAALTDNVAGLRTEFSQFRTANDVAHIAIRVEIGQMHEHSMTRLQGVEDTMNQRFDQVDARFDKIDAKFDRIDAKFDAIDAKFKAIDERFAKVDTGIDVILSRLPPP